MQNMAYNKLTIERLVNEPLGVVASQLRLSLDPKKLAYNTRAISTFLNRSPDKSVISFTATIKPSSDISLSSWAKLNCYELDFNLGLGKPQAVRRPKFGAFESLMYLMPKTLDGEIAVAICLSDEDMEKLKIDKEFTKYGKYIG
jgi:hypothetical protein